MQQRCLLCGECLRGLIEKNILLGVDLCDDDTHFPLPCSDLLDIYGSDVLQGTNPILPARLPNGNSIGAWMLEKANEGLDDDTREWARNLLTVRWRPTLSLLYRITNNQALMTDIF